MCPDAFEVFGDCLGLYATDNSKATLWNVVVGSVMMVPATCLVEYPVLQLKFSRLNQELRSLSSLHGTLSQPCCPRHLPFHTMADTFDTVLELGKVFKYSAKKKQCS